MNKSTGLYWIISLFFTLSINSLSVKLLESSMENKELSVAEKFNMFQTHFHKQSSSKLEGAMRKAIFDLTLKQIESHNSKPGRTFDTGVNEFSDLSFEEFQKKYLIPDSAQPKAENQDASDANSDPAITSGAEGAFVPYSFPSGTKVVDWRTKGAVTGIRNQYACGSCWAFASVAAVESLYRIYKGSTVDLSEQELVDCQKDAYGCSGGSPPDGFNYIKNKGISYEYQYPYVAKQQTCKVSSAGKQINKIRGFSYVARGPDALANALRYRVTRNSLCVGTDFKNYKTGVLSGCTCTSSNGHAVNAVGYNFAAATKYFIIKNSWGKTWGSSGFGHVIASAGDGFCGRFSNPARTNYPYF